MLLFIDKAFCGQKQNFQFSDYSQVPDYQDFQTTSDELNEFYHNIIFQTFGSNSS
jgi:poly-D-alanine transfer protein DltD